jgi:hypothetical protein
MRLFQSTVAGGSNAWRARVRHQCQPLSRKAWLMSRRFAPRAGEPALRCGSPFLVSEAARLRHGHSNITPRLPAWAGRNPGVTEPTHALGRGQARCAEPAPARMGRARTNHSSHFGTVPPAPLAGLVSFPPAPFAAALCLAASAGCSRSFRRSQTAETGTDTGAPKNARRQWPRGFARPRHQH